MTELNSNLDILYNKYSPMVYRRCRHLLGDEDLAMDAMQETFIQILKTYDVMDFKAPSSLFYKIATNTCLNIIRHKKRHPEHQDPELMDALISFSETHSKTFLRQIFSKFSNEGKDTAVMAALFYYIDEMTLDEIGELMSISVSSVRRYLKQFKDFLESIEAVK